MADKVATLHIPGHDPIELPILAGTEGPEVIDVRALGAHGYFTFDPGFLSTASCESKITYIDGDKGILLYRGYPIAELAQHADYLQVCHLLMMGELPNQEQYDKYCAHVMRHTMVHEQMTSLFKAFRRDSHPMAVMCGVAGTLSAFYHDSLDMMFAVPCEEYKVNPVIERAMDKIFILHADHEQNASTSSMRLAGSSGANPFACVAAGIASLWGPSHGGANEACLKMLEEIGSVDRIPHFIARAKDKNDPFRLMGFGHRVYKNYDPRATVMRDTCHEVLHELNVTDHPLLDVAMELERIALSDPYFVDKKLYPNVDFYSGIILKAIGIPTSMFTVIFALSRTIGWISHWLEMQSDPANRISRPRQLYTGAPTRSVKPLSER